MTSDLSVPAYRLDRDMAVRYPAFDVSETLCCCCCCTQARRDAGARQRLAHQ